MCLQCSAMYVHSSSNRTGGNHYISTVVSGATFSLNIPVGIECCHIVTDSCTILYIEIIPFLVLQDMGEPPDSFNTSPPEFADIKLFTAEHLTEVVPAEDIDSDLPAGTSDTPADTKDGMQEEPGE